MAKLKTSAVETQKAPALQVRKFPIVGIGASAGGLEAFTLLLSHLPANTDMAFILVQHLSPEHESFLPEILAKITPMPVTEVKNGMRAKANCVYVIPPNVSMGISNGILGLIPRSQHERPHLAIDFFFRSLAEDQKINAIGIILSGTGSDGAEGLKVIKAEGGISFAQAPASAKFGGMPQRAIVIDHVDFILTPEEIAKELIKISKLFYLEPSFRGDGHGCFLLEKDTLHKILFLVKQSTHVDFSQYKRTTVKRRIMRRMIVHKVATLEKYYELLMVNPGEQIALQNDVLINVTSFFRDPEVLEKAKAAVFPLLLKERPLGDPIRIWVAGCATGEEVYSIAIVLLEYLGNRIDQYTVQIFGSDLSDGCIAKARFGRYSEAIAETVSSERLDKFFRRSDKGFLVSKRVRDLCVFAKHDLINDPPFSKLDIVSCRNVLIYFEPSLQRKALAVFNYALKPKGFLILGHSETSSVAATLFSPFEKREKIYTVNPNLVQKRPLFTPSRHSTELFPSIISSPPVALSLDAVERETDRLLAAFAPPSVVINDQFEVIQFRGDTTPFLVNQPGRAHFQILKMAREGLAPQLKSAIVAAKKGSVEKCENIKIRHSASLHSVSIEVIPLQSSAAKRYFLILFKEIPLVSRTDQEKIKGTSPSKGSSKGESLRVIELSQELMKTKEYLESLNRDMEVTNQELQSAHEEVLSANEELQSSNEELETAKEELQSGNEELTTVNDELQIRNLELDHLNNDLINLLANIEIPIVMIGKDGRIRRITPAAERALNLQATDVGRPMREIKSNFEVLKLDLDLEQKVYEVVQTMVPTETEIQDRKDRWFRLQIRPYRTSDNRIDGAVVVIVDIDGLKRSLDAVILARSEAEKARMAAEEGNRAKDLFLATLSHELRTPLTTILAYSQLLRLGKLDSDAAKKGVVMIEKSALAQSQLINDLLDVSRIMMGKLAFDMQDVDLRSVLHDAVESIRPLAEQKSIRIEEELLEQEVFVSADPIRLKQIFLNLITNAIKFSQSGTSIEVSLDCFRKEEREFVQVTIQDFGKGISEVFLPQLFERFSQADSSSIRIHGGMGLGLAIVRSLTESQGGNVRAESPGEGKGSTFTVVFPIVGRIPYDRSLDAQRISSLTQSSQANENNNLYSIKGLKILLVDDDMSTRDSLGTLLKTFEANVYLADSVQAAMKALPYFQPDILVSDMAMPEKDGCDLIRQIRKLPPHQLGSIPAVILTALAGAEDICKALAAGFHAHVAKPVDSYELIKVISETYQPNLKSEFKENIPGK